MTTYEWIGLIVVLIGGFWKLSNKLTKIEVALSDKVGYKECSEKRKDCPCLQQIEELRKIAEEQHPRVAKKAVKTIVLAAGIALLAGGCTAQQAETAWPFVKIIWENAGEWFSGDNTNQEGCANANQID